MKSARNPYEKSAARGFTIVELIIIIIVIAILASIAIISYTQFTKQSQLQTAKADAQTAAAAINKYKAENGAYPTDIQQVTIANTKSSFVFILNSGGTGNYCVQATYKDQVTSVKQGNTAAEEGACPPAGAAPATIMNLATNPSAENNLAGVTGFYSGVPARGSGAAVSGSNYFSVTTNDATKTQGLIHSVITGGGLGSKKYTCSMSFRGTDGARVVFAGRFNDTGNELITSGTGAVSFTLSGVWQRQVITFDSPANTGTIFIQYRLITGAAGVTIQSDALMCTQSAINYSYADGDSTGWQWAGERQQSTSSGPSTGLLPAN